MSTAIRAGQSSVDIGRALEALTAEMSQMCRLIEERVPARPAPRAWLTVKEAARLVGREEQTITGWCRGRRKIGALVLGRWRVDRGRICAGFF
jgi:hypothetical protein